MNRTLKTKAASIKELSASRTNISTDHCPRQQRRHERIELQQHACRQAIV